jgi:hypothetical protein
MTRLVSDYCAATAAGGDAIMIALRRSEVDALNRKARDWMTAARRLGPDRLRVGDAEFAPGDRIVLRNNNPLLGVDNGTR